ncbi:MAG TPA: hypothetical protein VMQ83_02110 [Gammaproteobacteria bacterium]|nr:hypothetical protein [Gammaproteobacteria bacterium]
MSGPVDSEPETARVPLQSPVAVHVVALVVTQFSVALSPGGTRSSFAVNWTAGGGAGASTATVTDWLAVPPGPSHESEKLWLESNAPVDTVPLSGRVPDQAPEAVQVVALEAFQASEELPPAGTLTGAAVSDTTGVSADVTSTVTDALCSPPGPVHDSE